MSQNYLSSDDLELIEQKLPPQFITLKDDYPVAILNIAMVWGNPPYPQGFVPHSVDIYYGEDAVEAGLSVVQGKIVTLSLPNDFAQANVIEMQIDGDTAYVQINGTVLLNRIGGTVLPEIFTSYAALAEAIGKALQPS